MRVWPGGHLGKREAQTEREAIGDLSGDAGPRLVRNNPRELVELVSEKCKWRSVPLAGVRSRRANLKQRAPLADVYFNFC